jgi:hypothetical protein
MVDSSGFVRSTARSVTRPSGIARSLRASWISTSATSLVYRLTAEAKSPTTEHSGPRSSRAGNLM